MLSTKGTRIASPTQRAQVFEHHGIRSGVMNYPDITLNSVVPPYWSVLSALEALAGHFMVHIIEVVDLAIGLGWTGLD